MRGKLRRFLRAGTIDLRPLRHRDYRLLNIGQLISGLGSQLTTVALAYQIYHLTGSVLAVGMVALTQLFPLLVTSSIGGALADAHDRRTVARLVTYAQAATSTMLAVNASLARPHVWVLYVAAALSAALRGLLGPSLEAMTPRLVPRDEIAASSAIRWLRLNTAMVAGPALGGVLISTIGTSLTYTVDVASFAASIIAFSMMKPIPPSSGKARLGLRTIGDGWLYARRRPDLVGSYLVDIVAMFFGMPQSLFPAIAERLGGARSLGFLYSGLALGAFVATATSGWTSSVKRYGRAIVLAALGWGVAIVPFGYTSRLPVAVACLAVAGLLDMYSALFRASLWNQTIPDEYRGRLAGIEQLSYSVGPMLGNVEAGVVASLTDLRTSIVSGGVLCVAGVAALAIVFPALWAFDLRTFRKEAPVPAPPEPAQAPEPA